MKSNIYIIIAILSGVLFVSCEDVRNDNLNYELNISNSDTATYASILRQYSYLKDYEDLTASPNFRLGVAIDLNNYISNEQYYNTTNNNFDEVTTGYEMKHNSVVKDDGTYNFADIDKLFTKADEAGTKIYGHTLVWHSGQNCNYLYSLIAPEAVEVTDGTNILDNSGLIDGTFTAWNRANPSNGISIVENAGMETKNPAVKLEAGATVNPWDLQLISPDIAAGPNHRYEISFFIRSEGDTDGKARMSFIGLDNSYPYEDWTSTGGEATENFTTNGEWKHINFIVDDVSGSSFNMCLDCGYQPNITYYIDATNFTVIDLDADIATPIRNYIGPGTFENGGISPWSGWDSNSTREVSAEGEGYNGQGHSMKLTCNTVGANVYDSQIVADFSSPFEAGDTYILSFSAKASVETTVAFMLQETNTWTQDTFGANGGEFTIPTEWTNFTTEVTLTKSDRNQLSMHFGYKTCSIYFDNMKLVNKADLEDASLNTTPVNEDVDTPKTYVYIDKSNAEKKSIVTQAMSNWIDTMVTHCNSHVKSWDVVNEALDDADPSKLKTNNSSSTTEFYWQDYMGKDYAATAFKLARQYASDDVRLFINDYGLAYNLTKCRALIDYVNYIEGEGATVDGIGTQMHIKLDINRDNIDQMFKLLAATGKMVRVSELDIELSKDPDYSEYMSQLELYQYVVNSYFENVPADQRYGICVWGINDTDADGAWLSGTHPLLFDGKYRRKLAYKGFADGLAAKDVIPFK